MMPSTPVLYVNMDMFTDAGIEPPNDWQQLVDVAKRMTTPSRKGLGLPDTWTDWIYGGELRYCICVHFYCIAQKVEIRYSCAQVQYPKTYFYPAFSRQVGTQVLKMIGPQ